MCLIAVIVGAHRLRFQPRPTSPRLPPVTITARSLNTTQPAITLGLWDGHDAGAALVVGGQVVAALSEERLTRRKHQAGFPQQSVVEVLHLAGVQAAQVDAIAVAGRYGRAPARLFDRHYAAHDPGRIDPLSLQSQAFAQFQHTVAALPVVRAAEAWLGQQAMRSHLLHLDLGHAKLTAIDHHLCHALAAVARAQLPALVLTVDGYGDGISVAVWLATGRTAGQIQRLHAQGPRHSPALLYGGITQLLGFGEGQEGKVTGLAALGKSQNTLRLHDQLRHHQLDLHVQVRQGLASVRLALWQGLAAADVAWELQRALTAAILPWAAQWRAHTGVDNLALAGGLFANVALNGALAAQGWKSLSVCPAMGDQGLCVGAALAASGHLAAAEQVEATPWPSLRLGTPIASVQPPPPAQVATSLATGAVWGVARGALEFGPRALGARSIIADPRQRQLVADLNERLHRDAFMPLAPVFAQPRWAQVISTPLAPVLRSSGDMTVALPVTPAFATVAPAVVHVDGTARPQALAEHDDPWLFAVVQAFAELTGCPALVNTSFNRHGEPIVRTAQEALASALAIGLDVVLVGDEVARLK